MKKILQSYDESRNNVDSGFRNGSRDAHILDEGSLTGCEEQYTATVIQAKLSHTLICAHWSSMTCPDFADYILWGHHQVMFHFLFPIAAFKSHSASAKLQNRLKNKIKK